MHGYDHAVYNVHAVVHLADDASQFGLIENISSFPYEYFLHKFKRLIRKPEFPLIYSMIISMHFIKMC
jgi:hypothetical protein